MKQRIGYLLVQNSSKSVKYVLYWVVSYVGLRTDIQSLSFIQISLGRTLKSTIHLQLNLNQLHTSTMGPKRRLPAKQTPLAEAALSQIPATQVLDSGDESIHSNTYFGS